MPAKRKVSKVAKVSKISKATTSSLQAVAKQSRSVNNPTKIATLRQAQGKLPRNDKKMSRVNLSIPVYSLAGNAAGTLALPKEIFGQKVNKQLLSQAIRIYATNKKALLGSTKTRGEVEGSTAKIYRQKGTGRARHGTIRAPIFVGGGITFGPKPRQVRLDLPKRMKRAALLSALSAKVVDKNVIGLSGMEKASGKTKEMAKLMSSVVSPDELYSSRTLENRDRQSSDKKQKHMSALIVTAEKADNVVRGVRNIPGVSVLPASLINAHEVLRHDLLLVTKKAVDVILGTNEVRTPESSNKDSGRVLRLRSGLARMTMRKGK